MVARRLTIGDIIAQLLKMAGKAIIVLQEKILSTAPKIELGNYASLRFSPLRQGEKVQLSGFGTFEIKAREARIGRNPHTREAIDIPATSVPVFKASKVLKDTVAK